MSCVFKVTKNKMPKTYYCNKLIDGSVVCGETNPENFTEGRYNTCRTCRLQMMSSYNKNRREEIREKKIRELDPSQDIRFVVEDTIKRIPLLDGKTISDKITNLEEDIGEVSIQSFEYNERLEKLIFNLQKQIDELKNK